MDQLINDKIQELFNTTPEEVGVGFGKKTVGNESTEELTFVFMVPEKRPLDQIPENEILPSTVDVDGTTYKTDVVEVGEIKLLACDSNTNNNCYGWRTISQNQIVPVTANQNEIRPLKGGIQISSYNNSPNFPTSITVGTLGFIAVDTATQALVGVSNNHVLVKNAFYTTERVSAGAIIENESDDNVYQNGFDRSSGGTIGKVMRYVPLRKQSNPTPNQVDGALIALHSDVVSSSESYLQYGLSVTEPMEFATTAEINNAISGNYPIASSGRSTGAKEGSPCGLTIRYLNVTVNSGPFHDNESEFSATFSDLIMFSRLNSDCSWPIYSGDSGSSLLAYINGVWKIIGLCFAGSEYYGFANRIDYVASQLGIEAWDGTAKPFIDIDSIQIKAVAGISSDKTIVCGGTTYWQVGSGNSTNYC